MKLTRLCIYPKDVQRITGKSEKASRRLLHRIKASLGKQEHQFITTDEFASHTGIKEELVLQYITD
ncbi:hypothetical protein [Carboxylicivirga sp. M1479]|uniref:hypothetical protein n=2 Tax=Carboxylicivirga TaxID=1628153 RepID=UPI001178A393|nr:hypothetical protein [Carboxylicivirga sp. M1479]TRX72706.1 hypothetical protein FNN09_01170 [Carboxylicivirga sp. M1479]